MAHILIVDDQPEILAILERMLQKLGHESIRAANGREALRRLEEARFDLVITDLIMPDVEGIETIAAIRKQWPGMRVIAMSGGGRQPPGAYLAIASSLGADATLAKPFNAADLAATVRQVLGPDDPTSSPASRS